MEKHQAKTYGELQNMRWNLFGRNQKNIQTGNSTTGTKPLEGDSLVALNSHELLKQHKDKIENLYSFTQLDRPRFDALYVELFKNIALYVQKLPASENHHHAYLGGLLEHSIEVATYCGRIAGRFLYIADGEEKIGQWSALYTYAMASAGALHDVGKALTDIDVVIINGKHRTLWMPHKGPIPVGSSYIYQYNTRRVHGLHELASLPLLFTLMPQAAIDWIWQKSVIRDEWLATIGGQAMDKGGSIGRCVIECDSASTGHNMQNAPLVKTSESENNFKKPGIHALTLKGILLSFRDYPPNSDKNPFWISQHYVACVCPRFVEIIKATLGTDAQYLPDNSSLVYDALQDRGVLIPNITGKAVHALAFNQGQRPLSVILIKREHIDPEMRLPVYGGQLLCPSMPQDLHHSVPGKTSNLGTQTQQNAAKSKVETSKTITPAAPKPIVPSTIGQNISSHSRPIKNEPNKQDIVENRVDAIPQPQVTKANNLTPNSDIAIQPDYGSEGTHIDESVVSQEYGQYRDIDQNAFREFLNSSDREREAASTEHKPSVIVQPVSEELQMENEESKRKLMTELFIDWLRANILTKKILVNQRGGVVHFVEGNRLAIVSPSIFHRYILENEKEIPRTSSENRERIKFIQHSLLDNLEFEKSIMGQNMLMATVEGSKKSGTLYVMVMKPKETKDLNLNFSDIEKNKFVNILEGFRS